MKIAVWHNLPSGGAKRALYYHIRGLVSRGHRIEAWCPDTADQSYLPLGELVTEHVLPLSRKSRSSQKRVPRAWDSYASITSMLGAMQRHCQQCAKEMVAGEFDLLFANSCMFFCLSPMGRCLAGPKLVYLQEPYRPLYEASPRLPWLALPSPKSRWRLNSIRRFLLDWIQVQALRIQAREEWLNAGAFDTILVNSLYSRESLLRAYGLEAKVCYLGVDTGLFRPTVVPKENFVVGMGAIHRRKGLDRVVHALARIEKRERPGLVWIGNFFVPRYQAGIEELAHSLDVDLTWKIRVADDELVSLLNQAQAMIYTPRLEPFGFAPLEANACGTPVVAIAEGGIRETIVDGLNGILIYEDDPDILAKAILDLLGNPGLVQRMGLEAREYVVRNWNWETAVKRLEGFLVDCQEAPKRLTGTWD